MTRPDPHLVWLLVYAVEGSNIQLTRQFGSMSRVFAPCEVEPVISVRRRRVRGDPYLLVPEIECQTPGRDAA